jgi:hypothetical protein
MTSNLELNCVTNRSMCIKHTDNWPAILNLNSIMDRTLIRSISLVIRSNRQAGNLEFEISESESHLVLKSWSKMIKFCYFCQWTSNLEFELRIVGHWSISLVIKLTAQVKQAGNLEFEISQSEPDVVLNS